MKDLSGPVLLPRGDRLFHHRGGGLRWCQRHGRRLRGKSLLVLIPTPLIRQGGVLPSLGSPNELTKPIPKERPKRTGRPGADLAPWSHVGNAPTCRRVFVDGGGGHPRIPVAHSGVVCLQRRLREAARQRHVMVACLVRAYAGQLLT